MIAFIKGSLYAVQADTVVVDVNGVGYRLQVPLSVIPRLPGMGMEVVLYTHMHMREDGINLFGFDTEEALELFRLLLGVSGVGPKGALGILSTITPENFSSAVITENAALISRAPGVGKKTAQRIILELKEKITKISLPVREQAAVSREADDTADAVNALIALGYGSSEAFRAVHEAGRELEQSNVEDLIKLSLKRLSGNRKV